MNNRLQHIQHWLELAPKARYRSVTLARICQVSVRQLERYFLKHFQQTPHQWLRTARLNRAVELLKDGSSVKETAMMLGYKAVPHFTRDFKQWSGMPPTRFTGRRFPV
jgi:transcriptional regulator GlxA family with amidase domain